MRKFSFYLILSFSFSGSFDLARACDLCGCYTPQLDAMPQMESTSDQPLPAGPAHRSWADRDYFAIAEQFTHFGTVQVDGEEMANPTGQYLNSSITQLVGGYSFNPRFALQLNVPLIYRSFERPEGLAIDRGTESGLGDISLLAKFVLFHIRKGGARRASSSMTRRIHSRYGRSRISLLPQS